MEDRTCALCTAPIVGRNSRAVYCSRRCAARAADRARKNRQRPVRNLSETADCPQCATSFEVWVPRQCGGFARRSYCAEACAKRAEAARRRRTESGRRYYEQYRSAGKFAANNRKLRAARRRAAVYLCAYCACPTEGTEGRPRVTCGSAACLRANDRQHTTTRNARKQGATLEAFRFSDIFERDEWMCRICEEPVDPETEYPHPLSVSLDHVRPIARGGTHSRANVQTAHLTCNLRKSATWESSDAATS